MKTDESNFPYNTLFNTTKPVDGKVDTDNRTREDNKLFVCTSCQEVWQFKTHPQRISPRTNSPVEYYGTKNVHIPSYGKKRVVCPKCEVKK